MLIVDSCTPYELLITNVPHLEMPNKSFAQDESDAGLALEFWMKK